MFVFPVIINHTQFGGGKNVKVEVLDVKDTVRKEDAENLYKYL